MSENDNESGVSGLGWFLAGLGVGALVGVLYAPKAGKETREDLVASALDARDRAAVLHSRPRTRPQFWPRRVNSRLANMWTVARSTMTADGRSGPSMWRRARD